LISKTPGIAGGAIGIITLEDIIEVRRYSLLGATELRAIVLQEIITEEIVDETDTYEDNTKQKRARRATTAEIMRG